MKPWLTTSARARAQPPPAIDCERSNGSRIALLQGDRNSATPVWSKEPPGWWLSVYAPATETLRLGLKSQAAACGYELLPLRTIMVGARGGSMQRWLRRPKNVSASAGDMVIFVGEVAVDSFASVCMSAAKWQGARCVLYWTEPRALNRQLLITVHEVWFYSRRVLNLTARSSSCSTSWCPVFRYVPPGFVACETGAWVDGPPVVVSSPVDAVLFLGQLKQAADERKRTYRAIGQNPLVGPRLRNRYDVWSSADWARLAPHVRATAFLNLHRLGPEADQPIEAFRLSRLLSIGAVVVSQAASADDLAEYHGMLLVEPNISAPRWSAHIERLLFSSNSTAALTKWQASAYQRFRRRFLPAKILHRASVWSTRVHVSKSLFGVYRSHRPTRMT